MINLLLFIFLKGRYSKLTKDKIKKKQKTKKIRKNKARLFFTQCIIYFIFILLFGRLFYLMAVNSKFYKTKAIQQWTSEITIEGKRGEILDRNGQPLAFSADVYRVDLDLVTLRETIKTNKLSSDQAAAMIASALNMDVKDVSKAINKTSSNGSPASYIALKRQVEKSDADKVKALKLRGIILSQDTKRFYSNGNFLAHVLGSINGSGHGVSGVELQYDKILSGTPGYRKVQADAIGYQFPYNNTSKIVNPINGQNVVLTIDTEIQHYAEKAADKALSDNKAKAVTIIVMDPKTGEILAMVNKPDFNPNAPTEGASTVADMQKLWSNRAIETSFEPGSIYKVITAAAAMEKGVVKESDTFVCNGSLKIAGSTIYCWERDGQGTETFPQILQNSCNVGFMQLGQKLGKDNLYNFTDKVGFGHKTGIDLPGEADGIVRIPAKIGPVELATMSFGQGIAVNGVQYMAAFNAVANGGTWIKPHIMKEIAHYDDNNKLITDNQFNDYKKRQIIDPSILPTLRDYLERVVEKGVGQNAFIAGYHIGGKTGTAQKAGANGGYEAGKYMASFAGMAPVSDPRITMLVSIDEPDSSNYYAGQTAAPVAKELYNEIFNYIQLKEHITIGDVDKAQSPTVEVVPGASKH